MASQRIQEIVMKKVLFLMLVLSVVIVSISEAQTVDQQVHVVVEISNKMTDGKWVEGRSLTWTRENDENGNAVEYTDAPDHNAYSTKDPQIWYVPVGDVLTSRSMWWKYTFSAAGENLKGQYAIRVAVDGLLSEWVAKVIGKGRSPRSG